ncbi:type VII secretion protein EccB [Kineococcus xinjiangensis]|uniref:type VII secretion protein EccB n=1 Tax=Kineococcus xinjiangensis TaxID=512762 RepID=UPI001304FD73|nr:type VII secretion protein EccB [Kineococcus xinjiangensis]
MSTKSVLIDAEDFARRRGVAALQHADSLDVEEVPRRPNAAVIGGFVLAFLIAAGSAGSAYVSGRAPSGWQDDATLVIDKETGARFVADDGVLRPAPTLSAALLAGARNKPTPVPHAQVMTAPLGPALPGADLPERPPVLPSTPTGLVACAPSDSEISVFNGAPEAAVSAGEGLLVRASGDDRIVLVSGRMAHDVDSSALARLGYSESQVTMVPAPWLELVPKGPALQPLALPVRGGATQGVAGVGADGDVVKASESGRHYLIAEGRVHPFANRTSELLAPQPVRTVTDSVLSSAPVGAAVGIAEAPSIPPVLPAPEDVVVPCVRSYDGLVAMLTKAAHPELRASLPQRLGSGEAAVTTTWHARPGEGALLGPMTMDDPVELSVGEESGTGGMRLIAEGRAHVFADEQAVQRMGYRRLDTVKLPQAWLDLFPQGGTLRTGE